MNIAGGLELHTLILIMIKYIQNSQNLKSEKILHGINMKRLRLFTINLLKKSRKFR